MYFYDKVTNKLYIWGSIYSKNNEIYKINEPRLLIEDSENEDFEQRYVKIECGAEDLYFLDSTTNEKLIINIQFLGRGKIYYYSMGNIEKCVKKAKIINSICNQKMRDIVLNKSEGFLIALSEGILKI